MLNAGVRTHIQHSAFRGEAGERILNFEFWMGRGRNAEARVSEEEVESFGFSEAGVSEREKGAERCADFFAETPASETPATSSDAPWWLVNGRVIL